MIYPFDIGVWIGSRSDRQRNRSSNVPVLRTRSWPTSSRLRKASGCRGAGSEIFAEEGSRRFPNQQPDGGVTPGVAVAPVALAGAIMPGVARFIVIPSAHADVFGVGTTVVVGSMLVMASSVTSG
jgi:hypothetical protein